MKTVICTTDASPMGRNAVHYVKNFCRSVRPSLILLEHASLQHLFTSLPAVPDEYYFPVDKAWNDSGNSSAEVAMLTEPSVRLQAIHSIAKNAVASEADMLITGVDRSFTYADCLGQPLAELVKQAKCPALLIPETVVFKPIQRILLVIDHECSIEPRMKFIEEIARNFGAEIFLYQLNRPCAGSGTHPFYQCSVDFYFTFPYSFIHFEEAETENTADTICKLVQQTKADLLITVPEIQTQVPGPAYADVSDMAAQAASLDIPLLAIDTQPRHPVESTGYPFE
ncbi:hypothetical protein Q0590_09995 [Rhodocytophaga aerolata]|uniref:Universal stress protein n=1 Tax=Rhodocytophaga aerolata TaxID=455078 RepID=A0ABT8R3A2_9BACT|nr:hypothetical protein [Rhodocytophaga aerolata]MDO1446582.1 hypothetical protein [Rhodocytophaga aerolata]